MSLVEQTGRARASRACRWCGPKVDTVVFEVRDTETGGIGSEVMCLTCGKHQYRWGCERLFWAEETHKELVRGVLVGVWLAAQIIQLAQRGPAKPEQLDLFMGVIA